MHANERRLVLYSFIMRHSTQCVKIISFEGKRQLSCFMHSLFSSIPRSRRRWKNAARLVLRLLYVTACRFHTEAFVTRHRFRVRAAVMGRDTSGTSG